MHPAQFETARDYAARLKTISSDDPDMEVKQVEALSFLGDDVGVRDAYQRAQERLGELPALLLHLAATAHHRLGDEKTAWRLWGEAVKQEPSLELAQNNFVINFIRIVDTPGLVDTLQDFAMGRYGSDDIRMEAMQFISQKHPDRLSKDRMVPMWLQGRQTEIFLMGEEMHSRFPDYLFARIGLARMYVLENRIQEAKDLVAPLLRRDRLHVSEFRALAQTEMEIALAEEQKESARSWLNMWMQVEEDHPDLMRWQLRIEGQDGMMRMFSKLLG